MLRSTLVSTVALAVSLAGPAVAQNRPQNPPSGQGQQGQQQGGGRPQQQEGPRPYQDVITPQMQPDSGVFIIYRSGEKLFYEIPRNMLGREFLLIADYRGTTRGVNLAGEELNNRIVRWERLGNRVLFRIVSYENRADTTRAVSRAVSLSNLAPIVMSFDIAAFSPGGQQPRHRGHAAVHDRRRRAEPAAGPRAGTAAGSVAHGDRARAQLPAQRRGERAADLRGGFRAQGRLWRRRG